MKLHLSFSFMVPQGRNLCDLCMEKITIINIFILFKCTHTVGASLNIYILAILDGKRQQLIYHVVHSWKDFINS